VGNRRGARRRALQIIYEADISGITPLEALERHAADGIDPFTRELVTGVQEEMPQLDEKLQAAATDWKVARMAAVDRAAMRIACWEMMHGDVSEAVAISEAMEAVRELSTEDSVAFVNGVLGQVARS
jgi:N utilization substance protein B